MLVPGTRPAKKPTLLTGLLAAASLAVTAPSISEGGVPVDSFAAGTKTAVFIDDRFAGDVVRAAGGEIHVEPAWHRTVSSIGGELGTATPGRATVEPLQLEVSLPLSKSMATWVDRSVRLGDTKTHVLKVVTYDDAGQALRERTLSGAVLTRFAWHELDATSHESARASLTVHGHRVSDRAGGPARPKVAATRAGATNMFRVTVNGRRAVATTVRGLEWQRPNARLTWGSDKLPTGVAYTAGRTEPFELVVGESGEAWRQWHGDVLRGAPDSMRGSVSIELLDRDGVTRLAGWSMSSVWISGMRERTDGGRTEVALELVGRTTTP